MMNRAKVNRGLLRELARFAGENVQIVTSVETFPAGHPDSIVLHVDSRWYPEGYNNIRLFISYELNNNFKIHYQEKFLGDEIACRWDRHENTHVDSKDHFHPFPDASSEDRQVEERSFPDDAMDMMELVFGQVFRRIQDLE